MIMTHITFDKDDVQVDLEVSLDSISITMLRVITVGTEYRRKFHSMALNMEDNLLHYKRENIEYYEVRHRTIIDEKILEQQERTLQEFYVDLMGDLNIALTNLRQSNVFERSEYVDQPLHKLEFLVRSLKLNFDWEDVRFDKEG